MSLAPAERQALARIEDALRRSDPRLASMLTQFRLPLSRGGWTGLTRRVPRRSRPLVSVMVALIVLFLFVFVVVLSPGSQWGCGVRGVTASATPALPVSGCAPARHGNHKAGVP